MLAVQKPAAAEPAALVHDVPRPKITDTEVLIRVHAASLCGSDLEILGDTGPERATYPLIAGHEGAGEIVEVGASVTGLSVGDRVAVHYPATCGRCRHCVAGRDNRCPNRSSIGTHRDGTFAEYVAVPARNTLLLGDIPYEWGAIASCAVSTAYHAVSGGTVTSGDTVVVFGCGGVGLHTILWANYHGATTIVAVDIATEQFPLANEFGADHVLDPSQETFTDQLRRHIGPRGADVCIECSGAATALNAAVAAVNGDNRYASGTVVSVGLQTEPMAVDYWDLREGSLSVSGDHTRAEFHHIIKLLQDDAITLAPSVTHRFELASFFEATELLEHGTEPTGRIVITP